MPFVFGKARGKNKGSRGGAGGAGVTPPAIPIAPAITSLSIADTTLDLGATGTLSWSLSGGTPTQQILNPGDGSPAYTVSVGTTTQAHDFDIAGSWTVTLTVSNAGGSDVETLSGVVVAGAPPPPPPPPPAPDVRVLGNGNVISDGDSTPSSPDHTVFITAVEGAGGTTRTFTVENTGSASLTTSGLTVPTGFTVTEGLSATIGVGASDTFTVQLDDATVGTKSGNISFATNVTGKNPYNFAVTGEVAAPSSVSFYDWGTFSSMTETRRNHSGGTVSGAPVKWKAQFHKGEVTTSRWFDLYRDSVLVPSNEWQLGEISTYPDGSMRSAVVRCYGKASWANNSNSQFELVGKSGSWPTLATNPASDSTAITKVTGASALKLMLEDITLLGSPYGSTTQPAYGAPNLDSELNRALARTVTRKYVAGDICVAWRTWEKMQPPGGGTEDNQLWVLWFVEAWLDPSNGNLLHLSVEPYLNHGWARVQGMLKAFKMKLVDGATTLRDFSGVVTLDASDFENFNGLNFTGVNRTVTFPYTTWDGRFGSAAKVGGDPPSGFTVGKIYEIGSAYSDGPNWEKFQRPRMNLRTLGQFSGGSTWNQQAPGTGGTTYTLTHYNYACDKQCMPIRDGSGIEFWPIGGASGKIFPAWTRAEKIRRMQTGMVPNVPLEPVTDKTGQTYQGHNFNSGGKNTGLLPLYNDQNNYTPGATLYHSAFFEDGGYWFSGQLHKSECSWWMFNLLNDTERFEFHRTSLMTAAESAGFMVGLNHYENSTDGGGVEIAYPLVINNGPDKAGTQYAGMGPCRPTAISRGGSNQVGVDYAGSQALGGGTVYDESTASHWSTTSGTGAHGSKEIVYAEALYCSPGYRELITHLWMRAALADFPTGGATPHYASNKVLNGTTYYRVASLATTPDAQKRAFVGRSAWLGYALSAPDTEPYRAMLDDIAADNVAYLDLAYDDPNVIGATAKVMGVPTGAIGGEEQAWHLTRVSWGALTLLKHSGIESANYLRFHTAFTRWYFNDPVDGSDGPAFHSTGWFGTEATHAIHSFDQAVYNTPANVACTAQWMRDEASSVTDGSRAAIALPVADGTNVSGYWVRFLTDGESVVYTMPEQDRQDSGNFIPDNGDLLKLSWNVTNPGGGSITALPGNTFWYLYDKTIATHTLKLTRVSGSAMPDGTVLSDGSGNTATVLYGGGYIRDHYFVTKPSPSNFVAGTLTASNGSTWTFSGTPSGYGYSYKLSETDPAVTITQKTWSTASVIQVSPASVLVVYKARRQGNQLGGLVKLRNNANVRLTNQGWLGHMFSPAQVAATMFGKDEPGLAPTIDALDDFYANVLAGQGFYFYEINDSSGAWSFHYAYPPGAT